MVSFSTTFSAMDLRKLSLSDQYLSSPRRKVVSPFGLGIMLSFIVFSAVLFHISFKGPIFNPVLNTFGSHSNISYLSWPFSSAFSSSSNVTGSGYNNDSSSIVSPVNGTLEANFTGSIKSLDLVNSDVKDNVFERAHLGNETEKLKNGSEIGKNAILVNGSGVGVDLGIGNVKNGSVVGGYEHTSSVANVEVLKDGDSRDKGLKASTADKRSYKECDIYNGRWVRDDTKPYYPPGSCPYIDRDFDCHLNGRPDNEYVKWRWQPYDCDIPRLNTTDFLERLRGKKLVFVGDSLNRNMWESLVCVLRHGVKDKKRVYEISGRHEFKKKGFYAFRFEDYNCSVDFVSSPFLVKESSFKGKNGSFETLRLDLMDGTTSMYHDADVLIFNTGHWWTHEKTSRGEDYYQEGNYIHPRLKVLEAFKRALSTWARWVDKNIDRNKAHVIFRGYSVTHFRGGPWNSGGQCHKETEPIFNETYLAKYPSKMKLLEYVLKDMKTPVTYLNISRLTDYRKDGHPSIYRPDYQAAQQEVHAQDCSHWCLPGVPDTWNELLYVSLLKSGHGSWRN